MHFSGIRLRNHKCFEELDLEFFPGVNVVVGKNNSGKSTLLKALAAQEGLLSRRDLICGDAIEKKAEVLFRVKVDWSDWLTDREIIVWSSLAKNLGPMDCFQSWLAGQDSTVEGSGDDWWWFRNLGLNTTPSRAGSCFILRVNDSVDRKILDLAPSDFAEFPQLMKSEPFRSVVNFMASRFYFAAQRVIPSRCEARNSLTLNSDCSNLPDFLLVVQTSKPAATRRFIKLVSHIFPDVTYVRSGHLGPPLEAHVLVWFEGDQDDERCSVPLSECGTGLSQVIGLCSVLAYSESPRLLAIDEPQSFLHPGALRRLVGVIEREVNRVGHQCIISTHSPEILGSLKRYSLQHLIAQAGGSIGRHLSSPNFEKLRDIFREIGVSPTDFLSYKVVIWVEGETEELVFREVLRHNGSDFGISPSEVLIQRVYATGDFDQKGFQRFVDLYRRLPETALQPERIVVVLDSEKRKQSKLEAMKKSAQQEGLRLEFLRVPMIENWLLDADALLELIQKRYQDRGIEGTSDLTRDTVKRHINSEVGKQREKQGATTELLEEMEAWVHGAKVIEKVLQHYQIGPNKPKDAEFLASRLLARGKLGELKSFVQTLIGT